MTNQPFSACHFAPNRLFLQPQRRARCPGGGREGEMTVERVLPEDPLAFIQRCVQRRQLYWTYHINMRLQGRFISRQHILDAVDMYEIVESYPEDKYLPSYLVYATVSAEVFHVLFAVDVPAEHMRVITAYRPDPEA
jgi:hypothetical protein